MAIGKQLNLSNPPLRRWRWHLAWAIFAMLAGLAWFWHPIVSQAKVGAAYSAHIGCSCRFIAGRELTSCRDDLESGMGLLMLSENTEAKSVTARYPMLARETATYRKGQGCVLEHWKD